MKEELFYTGIGSRETPFEILDLMRDLAYKLQQKGYILRSGGAPGADTAFDSGCVNKQIFVPWNNFQGIKKQYDIPPDAYRLASLFHPAWKNLDNSVKHLMARNCLQILGPDLKTPSRFVICWTPDGCRTEATRTFKTGGTGLAIAIADFFNIPVFNLYNESDLLLIKQFDKLLDIKEVNDLKIYIKLDKPKLNNSYYTERLLCTPADGSIFVFGSNLKGIHGVGAAKDAFNKYGAMRGIGRGLCNASYAIPTKDERIQTLSLFEIEKYILEFVQFTKDNPDKSFFVTEVGCGLAGHHPDLISPMFRGSINCYFPSRFKNAIEGYPDVKKTDTPIVLNKYKLEPGQTGIDISRSSAWGNPHSMKNPNDRDRVCDDYETYLDNNEELKHYAKKYLNGYNLICNCKPKRCHGDYLIRISNEC